MSCWSLVETNLNLCRDSLRSLVGPMKELTGINVGTVYRVMSDRCRRHCMSVYIGCPKDMHVDIYIEPAKVAPSKGAPTLSKDVPDRNHRAASHQKARQTRGDARDRQNACRPLRQGLYKPKRRLRLGSITTQLKPLHSQRACLEELQILKHSVTNPF